MAKPNPNRQLEDLKTAAVAGRLPAEREAWLNTAFYLGHQYVEWHAARGEAGFLRAIAQRSEGNEPRIVINKIMHFCREAQAEALQDRPSGDVLPASADYLDLSDARVAKAWIEDQSDAMKLDYDTKLSRATQWAILCGSGYLKWLWDGGSGYDGGKGGKPCLYAPSFFEIFLDPYARMFRDCRYIIQSCFMDVEAVYDKYGVEVKGAPAQADEAKTALLRGMGCAPALSGVVVNELWQVPSRRYPEGRYAVWTGTDQLVPPDKLPYPHLIENKMLPYTQLGVIERPDSPYYLSPVQYLRPAQMELNVAHNQAFALRRNFANGKIFLPDGLELNEPWDDSTGQTLKGMPGSMPGLKPEIIQPVYASMSQDIDLLEQGMMHIVGQHEVSQAQVPGRVEAAKAIELLRESDADALAVLRKTTEVSNDVGWWQMLELARTYQTEAQAVTSYTKDGIPEVQHFWAGDLKPGYRVRTSMTNGLSRSRTNRIDMVMQMVQNGILDPKADAETISEYLEMPASASVGSHADDKMLARNENLTLAKGDAIVPDSWNDHPTHIAEHNKYRTTTVFQALSKDTKQKFEMHVNTHMDMEKTQAARQAALMMIAQGVQPGAPQPGAPQPPAAEPPQ